MSLHFAFVSIPAHGHVNPTLPLVEELVRRGHRVTYATGTEMVATVEKSGARGLGLPWELDPTKPVNSFSAGEAFAKFMAVRVEPARRYIPLLLEHFHRDRPDAMCYDRNTQLVAELAEKLGVPAVALFPMFASNEHFDLMKRFFSLEFEDPAQALVEVEETLSEIAAEYSLRKTRVTGIPRAGLKLVFIPRGFQIAGETFDDSYLFLGPSLGSRATSEEWQPPSNGARVLFISLGTIFNQRPEFFRLCANAFGGSDWHVVMAIGAVVDPGRLGPVPTNFDVRPYFPQPVVLSHAAAFVSHTGMNSTMESLYYQVPLLSLPQMAEQAANGDRVQELGLGRRLDPQSLTPQLLRDAVRQVADDRSIRAALARFNPEMTTGGGAAAGADAVEAYRSNQKSI
ncbi:MAG: glycosyl transferase [Pseudonocardiales bacterium]|nr:glycosyl transferase [Pseudonocardiales bacterium]